MPDEIITETDTDTTELENEELEGLVNPDGTFVEGWLDRRAENEEGNEDYLFDEKTRNDQLLKTLKGMPDLVKNFRSAQKLVGKNRITLPGEDATDEEWDEVFKKLGMPEKAEGYGLVMPETVPEEMRSPALLEWYGNTAHKYRLLPWQAKGLFDEWNEMQAGEHKKTVDDFNVSLETGMAKLKDKLGATFNEKMDACDALINAATDGLEGGDDLRGRLENDVRRDPRIAEVFVRLGEMISEDRMGNISKQNLFALRPSEAQEQLNDIMNDPKHPYYNRDHPGHKSAVAKVTTLHNILAGGK